jgi:putative nucleotidyltransferase with HDIG domain
MPKHKIAALIIAAGYSSRMHSFKPLLPLGGVSALKRLIQTYKEHGIKSIYVVSGHNQQDINKELENEDVCIVYNEEYDKGMFSSIQTGLRALDEHSIEAFYMNPVDIPLVRVQSLESLYKAYEKERKGVTYPTFLNKKGHPPLIDMKYKEQILSSDGEGGLKRVLEAFKDDALHVSVNEQSILMDMDTKEDYETLLAYEALDVPTQQECLAIMEKNKVDERIVKHCLAVSEILLKILDEISLSHLHFDKNRLLAAALLHDIARKEKNHAKVGADKLRTMGYDTLGNIIETHMDIEVNIDEKLTENELLFLADKIVSEDKFCGFEERFEKALKKCQGNAEAIQNIQKRKNAVHTIIAKIEKLTGKSFIYG